MSKVVDDEMVLIPESHFTMGIEGFNTWIGPKHEVYLDAYYIDKYEVTVKKFLDCVAASACVKSQGGFSTKKLNHPVSRVSWGDADSYCKWKNKRLPTEAEWENAARGKAGFLNIWTNKEPIKGELAVETGRTSKIGSFPKDKSSYGVYDMGGNVSEWVSDWYSRTYYSASKSKNPTGPKDGSKKSIRGASWYDKFDNAPSLRLGVVRHGRETSERWKQIGFRCAKDK